MLPSAAKLLRMFAGGLGVGPRFTASKAAVLPLDDLPAMFTNNTDSYGLDEIVRRYYFIILPLACPARDDPPGLRGKYSAAYT